MADHEQMLAKWVTDLEAEAIPTPVRDRVGLIIADTTGVIIGGASNDAVANLRESWTSARTGESGLATVLGASSQRASRHRAAFLNGTSGTALELDEGHRYAGGHPAIHVFPALLADAEIGYGGSSEFVAAFVGGYEVAVRVAEAMAPLADDYHPHGIWGAVGGAAAVARRRNFDSATTLTAMRIAANYAQHTRFETATEGATVRHAFAGMSNLTSLVAADQAEAGFTALQDGIARHLTAASIGGLDPAQLTDDLGTRWCVNEGYFKCHAACRYTHAALDALDRLVDTHDVGPTDVDSITAETYEAAARLNNQRPRNALQAKFSLPFAAATTLLSGGTGREAFSDAAITPEALDLADRVTLQVAPDIEDRAPEERGARVSITTTDERTVTEEVRAARGGESNPFSKSVLREKFTRLAQPSLGPERTRQLWQAATDPAAPRVLCTLARDGNSR